MDADKLYIRFDDLKLIQFKIKENIKPVVSIDPSASLYLNHSNGFRERVILSIPFSISKDIILQNIATLVSQKFITYYYCGDIHSSHYGISIKTLEGLSNSALFKETQFILNQLSSRDDIAGFVIKNASIDINETSEKTNRTFIVDNIKDSLDIKIGCRIYYSHGSRSGEQGFIPIQAGEQIIDQLYCNIENILLHNYVHNDELSQGHVQLTSTLLNNDIARILKRAKTKTNTRKKVLANLLPYLGDGQTNLFGDSFYDRFCQPIEETVREKTVQSENIYQSYLNPFDKKASVSDSPQDRKVQCSADQGKEASDDIAAYIVKLLDKKPIKNKNLSSFNIETSEGVLNWEEEINPKDHADLEPVESGYKKEYALKDTQTINVSEWFSNVTFKSVKRAYAEHPLKNVFSRSIPVRKTVLESAESNVHKRRYTVHPLKRQFLLYPFRSDFEKLSRSLNQNIKRLHPQVSDFKRRLYARRTSVPHPFNPNPPKNLGRRHYDKKDKTKD
ncbi:hypothetical protein KJ966_10555 [bacterium]|nr:hypothetical protein [bacterium]